MLGGKGEEKISVYFQGEKFYRLMRVEKIINVLGFFIFLIEFGFVI